MTKIFFILKNMYQFFLSEKTLTILILLGMLVCDTIFLVFGNIFWSDARNNEYRAYENNVVEFGFSTLNIDEFVSRTNEKDYIYSTSFEHKVYRDNDIPITISSYSPMLDLPKSRIVIGSGLKDENNLEFVMSDTYVMNRSTSNLPMVKINDTLNFLNDDWKCCGTVRTSEADNFDILISLPNFKSHIKDNIIAKFRFTAGTSLLEIQNYANTLKFELGADFVTFPSKTVQVSFMEFLSDMSGMLILLVIAIINYMFLYRFLLTKRTYTYGILKLYGMNKQHTLLGLSFEMLIFLIISFSLSLFFYLVGLKIFGQIGLILDHIPEFIFAFIVILVLNSIFFIFTAKNLICNSPTKLIKESVVS